MTLKKHAGPAPTCGWHIPAVCQGILGFFSSQEGEPPHTSPFIMHFRSGDILQDVDRERFPGCRWTDMGGDREKRTQPQDPLLCPLKPLWVWPSLLTCASLAPVRPSHLFCCHTFFVLLASMLVNVHTGSQKRTHTPNLLHSFQLFMLSKQSGLHQPNCDLSHFETFGHLYKES